MALYKGMQKNNLIVAFDIDCPDRNLDANPELIKPLIRSN